MYQAAKSQVPPPPDAIRLKLKVFRRGRLKILRRPRRLSLLPQMLVAVEALAELDSSRNRQLRDAIQKAIL